MKKIGQYTPKKSGAKKFKLNDRKKKYRDKDWTRYSHRFLSINSKCYVCESAAKHVDHLHPASKRPDLFDNLQNHIPMCVSCHSTVTAKFDRKQGENYKEKIKWIVDQRKFFNITVKIKILDKYS